MPWWGKCIFLELNDDRSSAVGRLSSRFCAAYLDESELCGGEENGTRSHYTYSFDLPPLRLC